MFNVILQSPPILFLTQSFWRDEAYSVLISQKPISTYFNLSFEPPLYYILLHFWIKLFGTSEIAVRSLSLLAFLVAIYGTGILAKRMYGTTWLTYFLPILFFINPMLFYYAFEARSYGWYLAFTVISTFSYFEKKWLLYIISTTLGLYTHAYMVFVVFVQCIHYFLVNTHWRKTRLSSVLTNSFMLSLIGIGCLYTPWLSKMYSDIPRLKQSWYFPVDTQLFKSVLGNIFLGYEGTPWDLWKFMERISYVIFLVTLIAFAKKQNRTYTIYFFILLYIPLVSILVISLYKPLYVMRYMIPATISEIFLITAAIYTLKNTTYQKLLGTMVCVSVIIFSFWFAPFHKKNDMRKIISEINTLQGKQDAIFVDDALLLYEAMYYNKSEKPIYWYNPDHSAFPWYIGDYIVEKKQIVTELPPYPYRAFLLHLNGSYEMVYNAPITVKKTDSNKRN